MHYGVRHKIALNLLASKLNLNPTVLKKEIKKTKNANKLSLQQQNSCSSTSIKCQFCAMQFKSESDHSKHIVMHLKHVLSAQLPSAEPFKCPKCDLVTTQQASLLLHYGTQHYEIVTELLKGDLSQLKIDMSFVQPTQQKQPPAQQQPPSQQPSQTTQQVEMQKQLEESKRFPKCKLCDYRYFTRLDLCRHFVDFHLRQRLVNCIDPHSQR